MLKNIANRLKIYEDEIILFLWAVTLLFFIRCACIIFNNFTETAFLKRFGVEYLPIVYGVNSIATFIIMAFMTGYMKRLPGTKLLFYLLLFCGAVSAGLRFTIPFGFELLYPVLFVLNTQFEILLILIFWNLGNDLFNTRQSKRIFPLITAGGVIGRIVGSFATPFFVKAFSFDNLMWVYCGFTLVAALIANQMDTRFPTLLLPDQKAGQTKKRTPIIKELKMVWPLIQESTLVKILIFLTLLPNMVIPILNYQFNFAVNDYFASESGMVLFFGYFRGVINIISLILLLFVGRIYGRWGLPVVMLFHPINYLIVFLSFFLRLNIFSAIYARLSTNIIRTTMNAPAVSILMGLFNPSLRNIVRPFLRGTVVRIGTLTGSGLILLFEYSLHPRWLSLTAMMIVAGWIITTLFLKRKYAGILLELISQNMLDLKAMEAEDVKNVFNDKAARKNLVNRFLSASGTECLWYARLLRSQNIPDTDKHILSVLDQHDGRVTIELMGLLSADAGDNAVQRLEKIAATTYEPALMIAILKALARLSSESARQVCQHIFETTRHPKVKAHALIPICNEETNQHHAIIDKWLRNDDPAWRQAGVIAAGGAGRAAYIPVLEKVLARETDSALLPDLLKALHQLGAQKLNALIRPYLTHDETAVRQAALQLFEIHNDDEMALVIGLLNDHSDQIRKAAHDKLKQSRYQNPLLLVQSLNLPRRKIRESIFDLIQFLNVSDVDVFRYARGEIKRAYVCLAEALAVDKLAPSPEKELLYQHLLQKIDVIMENVLRVLAARDRSGKMNIVWRGVFSNDSRQRSNSLEALESQIDPSLSEIMTPLLEKLSLEETLRTGERNLKLPVFKDDPTALYASLLSHDDWVNAILCLGHCGRKRAYKLSREMIDDLQNSSDPHVRRMTQWALGANQIQLGKIMDTQTTISDKILHLKNIQIFKDLAVSELAAVASVTQEVSVEPHQDFIKEGEFGDIMYLVVKGEVAVIKKSQHPDSHEIELDRIKTGDYFGEMALFEDAPRSATIRTLEKTWLLALSKNEFTEIVREYPQIALNICKAFGGRIRELHVKIKSCETHRF